MAETVAWPEGQAILFTGGGATSAVVAYAQDVRGSFIYGYENRQVLDGTYYDVLTGRRADVDIGYLYTTDQTLARLFESATAVHIHLQHSVAPSGVTAGFRLWSGRIDSLSYDGTENAPFRYRLTYHSNVWSAYGG